MLKQDCKPQSEVWTDSLATICMLQTKSSPSIINVSTLAAVPCTTEAGLMHRRGAVQQQRTGSTATSIADAMLAQSASASLLHARETHRQATNALCKVCSSFLATAYVIRCLASRTPM